MDYHNDINTFVTNFLNLQKSRSTEVNLIDDALTLRWLHLSPCVIPIWLGTSPSWSIPFFGNFLGDLIVRSCVAPREPIVNCLCFLGLILHSTVVLRQMLYDVLTSFHLANHYHHTWKENIVNKVFNFRNYITPTCKLHNNHQ